MRARGIVLDSETILSVIELVSPFEHVFDEGWINNPADIDLLRASNMNGDDSIVHCYWRSALSSLGADSVSDHEIRSFYFLDPTVAKKTILK